MNPNSEVVYGIYMIKTVGLIFIADTFRAFF